MHEQIGEHPTWLVPGLGSVHADTILTTWLVMAAALLFFAYLGRSYRGARVSGLQSTFEGIVEYLSDLSISTVGRSAEPLVPAFIGIFVFIFLLNQVGFIPWKTLGLTYLGGSPTADLNSTVAFALLVFFGIQFLAVRKSGLKAYAHLARPYIFLLPINVIEEIARPVVLALRLFFNIFVGELLLFVIATIIASNVKVGGFSLSLAAAVIPFLLQFFNFFVGTLQAFVFTLLTIVYLSLATADEH